MAAGKTYSFLDVQANISGPGIACNLGAGAGVAEEGITIDPTGDIDEMTIGADGFGMHSLSADKSGRFTVKLLKDSPVNAILGLAYATQTASGVTHGQNTILIENTSTGDLVTIQQAAFQRAPTVTYGKEGGMMEWAFNAVQIDRAFG